MKRILILLVIATIYMCGCNNNTESGVIDHSSNDKIGIDAIIDYYGTKQYIVLQDSDIQYMKEENGKSKFEVSYKYIKSDNNGNDQMIDQIQVMYIQYKENSCIVYDNSNTIVHTYRYREQE